MSCSIKVGNPDEGAAPVSGDPRSPFEHAQHPGSEGIGLV